MKLLLYSIFFLFLTKTLFAHGATILNPDDWKKIDQYEAKISIYDPILDNIIPKTYAAVGNAGIRVTAEAIMFVNENVCSFMLYAQIYDYEWAWVPKYVYSQKLRKSIHDIQDEMPRQLLNDPCALYEPEYEDYKKRSELITNISKIKRIKGNIHPVRYQKFKWKDNQNCLFLSGGLRNFYGKYYKAIIYGWFCVKDKNYLNKNMIKKITKSIGVIGFVDPPLNLRLNY